MRVDPSVHRRALWAVLGVGLLLGPGCRRPATVQANVTAEARLAAKTHRGAPLRRPIRAAGTIRAARAHTVLVPQIAGQGGRQTLVTLVANGAKVKEGDGLAEFDGTAQIDAAREAQAKYEDLVHQVRQKTAQNRSEVEKRFADLKEAEADLAKAQLQLRKGPVLSEIDRLKNEARAQSARARVASLKRINQSRLQAETAALRILELQMARQKVALERAERNSKLLDVRAPIAGMVALENLWRGGSMGHAQEGDQLNSGQALLKIFDPGEMEVFTMVGEPDGAVLKPGATALVALDAYPEAVFRARFQSASPVATAPLGSPIKNFTALFRIEQSDPRLLPDLSAAVVIQAPETGP